MMATIVEDVKLENDNDKEKVDANQETVTTDCVKDENETPTMSKSQLKKLRKKEKWAEVKSKKRKAERVRAKARKRECRERGEELGPTRKQLKHNTMTKSNCKQKVLIDCDFDDYMSEKDIKMLVKQIQFSYSANRRSENPLQFHCCGVNGQTKSRLESLGDYKGWDIHFHSESYGDVFEKSSLVYLSSESPNVLKTIKEDKVYIIGGLVDHNHHKGLCHRLAEERQIEHAQLPIGDYLDMKTRKVLAINHVFEILLHYTVTQDWQKAFYTVLPARKGAVPKGTNCDEHVSDNDSDNLAANGKHTAGSDSDPETCATGKTPPDDSSVSVCKLDDQVTDSASDEVTVTKDNKASSELLETVGVDEERTEGEGKVVETTGQIKLEETS